MTLLITRPRHDPATNYLYYWSESVIQLAKKKAVRVLDLAAEKANTTLLRQYCRKHTPSLFFFNGHGSPDTVTGHQNKVLVSAKDDLSLFSRSIVYCRSCDAALILGHAFIAAGTLGFIGYQRKFVVGYMPQYITQPLRDPLAKLFLEPSNLIPETLLKGGSIQDACNKSQTAMRANLRRMFASTATYEERYHAQFLWSNIRCQTMLGDRNATL